MRELELIERIRRGGRAQGKGVQVGIGDDCAVLRVRAAEELVVTTDLLLEGRHFRRAWHSAESAGWRCLARGLSDVAAMGGRPVAAFLSLALPKGFEVGWVDGFLSGFRELGARFGVELAGGDTAESEGGVVADVVVVGAVKRGRALLRSGARVGHGVYVTGRLGGSAVELAGLAAGLAAGEAAGEGTGARGRQTFPEPRVEVGLALARRGGVGACMDLSDGISSDLRRLCEASGVGVELTGVPVDEGATEAQALHGGEDYELLFTSVGRMPKKLAGVEVTRVGTVVAGGGIQLRGADLVSAGWEHFGRDGERLTKID